MIRTAIIILLMAVTAFAPIKRPHYIDIAPKSDIAYRSNNDVRGRKYFQQPMCGGVGILDYDGDGLMDVFFSNGAQLPELKKTSGSFYNCLLRNKGNNKFEDVTDKAGVSGQQLDFSYGVAVGDYDNDGRPDIFIANTGKNTLYHNNGNGAFSDVSDASGLGSKPPGTLSVQAAWFDYDNDGLLDLVLVELHDLEPRQGPALPAWRCRCLLQSPDVSERSATPLPQSWAAASSRT